MTSPIARWEARIALEGPDPSELDRIEGALRPESAREVPRSRAEMDRRGPGRLEIAISAQDAGALRAALNTYLGWIGLAQSAERVARAAGVRAPSRPPRSA